MVLPVPLLRLLPMEFRVLPARVRRSVLASAVPCTPPAALPSLADVLPWVDVPAWGRVPVVRPVRVVCSALPLELRLRVLLLVPALAPARLHVVPASVIRARAASRKGQ